MKRKGLIFVATLLLSVFSLCLVACSDSNNNTDGDNTPHVHDYKIEKSETMHWLKCDCGDTKDYNVHSGGTATCVAKAECSVCGETYGELGEHNYGVWTSNNNSTHSKVCSYESSHVITENCSGGTATEEERATCEVCNGKHGSQLNHTHNFNKQEIQEIYLSRSATCEERAVYYYSCSCGEKGNTTFEVGETLGHAYGEWVSNGDNTHSKTCSNDNNHKITENCNGGTATCEEQAICKDCGFAYGETLGHNYGVWVSNGNNTHTKICSNDNSHKITENCNGGTATCAIKAVCKDCKTSYGQLKDHPVEDWTITETHHYQQTTCSCNLKLNYEEHQTDDSGFCTSCDKAINPTVGILYDASSDGTYAEVIGYIGTSTKINIAPKYNNLPVKSIYREAFYSSSIKSVVIPDSVTSIGSYAFRNCNSLTSVTIGNSVTSIGYKAFINCDSLTSVTIGNSVTSIGNYAFSNCYSLTKVNYTGTIDQWAQIDFYSYYSNPLYYAKNLYINDVLVTEVVLTTATKISDYAFYNCYSLTSITIGDSVTSIGQKAFYACNSSLYTIENNLKYVKANNNPYCILVEATNNNLSTYQINSQTQHIAGYVFDSCERLTQITIPDSVTSIGDYAFYDCYSLTSVTIGNSVTSIGSDAFINCYSLTSVTIGNSVTSIGDHAFYCCDSLTSVTIPNSVTSIGDGAFKNCRSLTSVTIGNSVTSIGDYAFEDCDSLTSVTIPDSVTSIGYMAFGYCYSLTSITFSDTSTWYRIDGTCDNAYNNWQNKTGGTEIDVTDASNNARYFITYYWYKI